MFLFVGKEDKILELIIKNLKNLIDRCFLTEKLFRFKNEPEVKFGLCA